MQMWMPGGWARRNAMFMAARSATLFDSDGSIIVGDEDEFFCQQRWRRLPDATLLETEQAYAAWIPSSTGSTIISETNCSETTLQLIDIDADISSLDESNGDADQFGGSSSSGWQLIATFDQSTCCWLTGPSRNFGQAVQHHLAQAHLRQVATYFGRTFPSA
jgi:hypothetical protein